ncbi:hypothetical protein FR5810_00296 [Bordetella pertussis]|nr:hypothetical protein FR5810_00296 [Bordetella pertussis]
MAQRAVRHPPAARAVRGHRGRGAGDLRRGHAGAVSQSAGRARAGRHFGRRRDGRGAGHRADLRRLRHHGARGLRRQPAGYRLRLRAGTPRAWRGGPAAGRHRHQHGGRQRDRPADLHGLGRATARPHVLEHGQPGRRALVVAGVSGALDLAVVVVADAPVARHERTAAGRARGAPPRFRAALGTAATGAGHRADRRPPGGGHRRHRVRRPGRAPPDTHDAGRRPPLAAARLDAGRRPGPDAGGLAGAGGHRTGGTAHRTGHQPGGRPLFLWLLARGRRL